MPDVKITLTDQEHQALARRAIEDRRTPNDMAAYLIVKALRPKTPARRKAKAAGRALTENVGLRLLVETCSTLEVR